MEEKQGNSHFWLGVIVGALFMFLFTHKKGRKILKELSERGLDAFEDILDEQLIEKFEEPIIDEEVASESPKESEESAPRRPRRKFFRGIKRTRA